jgi:arsenite methyltransferase
MSLQAKMFNRKASDPRNKPDQILETLELQPGQTVVDIGAGGGYFSLRFAEAVGRNGKVYAIDTNFEFLEFIRANAREKGLANLEAVLVTEDNLALPERSLDLIFMRNICHHLQNRAKYFRELRRLLTPHGRIAIIEYNHPRRFSFRGIFGHYVPIETLLKEMREAGYTSQKTLDFLPEQSFMIFSPERKGNTN